MTRPAALLQVIDAIKAESSAAHLWVLDIADTGGVETPLPDEIGTNDLTIPTGFDGGFGATLDAGGLAMPGIQFVGDAIAGGVNTTMADDVAIYTIVEITGTLPVLNRIVSDALDGNNGRYLVLHQDEIELRRELGGVGRGAETDATYSAASGLLRIGVRSWDDPDFAGSSRDINVNGAAETSVTTTSGIGTGGTDGEISLGGSSSNAHMFPGRICLVAIFTGTDVKNIDFAAIDAALTAASRYEIFKRDAVDGEDTLVATVPAAQLTYTVTGLAADSVGYYWIRPVTRCDVGNSQAIARRLRRVALDGAGNLIPPAPNAPFGLQLTAGPDGQVTATWRYRGAGAEAVADRFFIYVAVGASALDFSSATDAVIGVRASNSFDLGTFQDGQIVRCAVRAATADNVYEGNTVEATTVADRTAPAAPDTIVAEVTSV